MVLTFYSKLYWVPGTVEQLLCLDVTYQFVPVFDKVVSDGGQEGTGPLNDSPFPSILSIILLGMGVYFAVFNKNVFLSKKRNYISVDFFFSFTMKIIIEIYFLKLCYRLFLVLNCISELPL